LINQFKIKENFLLHVALPQLIAFTYFYAISITHFFKPTWSYKLNADFEHHAESEYRKFVERNPQFKNIKVESNYFKYYGEVANLQELLLSFANDEKHHKEESLRLIESYQNN
ncbi:MAG TPA: alternative oxidase, partial [Vampirovibrionales bacterium]